MIHNKSVYQNVLLKQMLNNILAGFAMKFLLYMIPLNK